jgi:hypothetical protein
MAGELCDVTLGAGRSRFAVLARVVRPETTTYLHNYTLKNSLND